jgi:hypothetical protein
VQNFEDLANYDSDFCDVILLFEANGKGLKKEAKTVNVPYNKIVPFW